MNNVINKVRLNALRDALDPEDFAEVVVAFGTSISALLEEMTQACREGDAGALQRLAHSLKSASASLGADRLSGLAQELENRARSGEAGDALSRIAVMHNEFEIARDELERDWC